MAKKKSATSGGRKEPLTREEMLVRVPDKPYLTTPEVQHVFNDAHEVTIYKWVQKERLKAYRTNNQGKANLYKREDVIALIEDRFTLVPAKKIRESDDGDEDEETTVKKKRSKKRRSARANR